MAKTRIIINLAEAHEKSGLTPYAVAKRLNMNENTVRKYATAAVEARFIPDHVIDLCNFYGVDWRDPNIIEIIEEEGEDTQPIAPIDNHTAGAA